MSESGTSVNHLQGIVVYDPVLGTQRYATGAVLTNSTPQHVALVDGDGTHITSIGGGTEYNTNVAYADGNTGKMVLAVRDDSLTTLTPADGDFVPLRTNSVGALHVTGGGGGTEYTEDVATANPQVGSAIMMERDDALTTVTPIEGDWIGLRGSAEGALWTQDFNSDAILADTNTIAGAVSGTEMQVDVVAPLPAGTNAIGKLAANSGVDIGDVDVTSFPSTVHSADYDSGAGTDTTLAFGIAVPASGGAAVIPGDPTAGLKVDLGADNDVIITSGTVTANLSATDNAVLDQIEVNTSYGDNTGGGTEAGALRVTVANDSTGVLSVDDNGGSLTVDGTVTANLSATDNAVLDQIEVNTSYGDNTGGGTEAGVLRVTIANDSTGVLSVDDNGASLTVDNTNIDNLHSSDFDSGAGTDTTPAIGIAVPASGGAAVIPGDATAGLKVDLGADNDVTVTSGTVTANAGTGNFNVNLQDGAGTDLTSTLVGADQSLDVNITQMVSLPSGTNAIGKLAANSGVDIGDVTINGPLGGGTEAGALRVTIANDSTGVLSIDDGGGSLTIDGTVTANLSATDNTVLDNIDTNTDWGQLMPTASTDWKYADINDAVSGDNTIIAAQGAGNKIAVWSVMVVSDGTVDVRFEDGAGGTAFTGQIPLQAREGFTYSAGGLVPLWVGSANTLLNLELSAAINVHGHVAYTVTT